jgi:hypothetical protein
MPNGYDPSRGNYLARRARKLWLIATYGWPDPVNPFAGLVLCWLCDVPLTYEDLTVDRWPVPGCKGGTYARSNIRPACIHCNSSTGGALAHRNRRSV